MKGIISAVNNFFTEKQIMSLMNVPLLIITLVILLVALWVCIIISRKHKLYIPSKE